MKFLGNSLAAVVVALLAIAIAAPRLIALGHALVPVLVVSAVAVIAVRWVFYATRRW